MPITVSCECGKRFSVGDQLAGKRGKCKACGQVITIPAATAPVEAGADFDLAPQAAEPLPKLKPRSAAQYYVPSSRPAAQPAKKAPTGKASNAPGAPSALPAFAGAYKPQREKPQSAMRTIPLPPPVISFLIIASIIAGISIYWANNGPIKATHEWAKIRPVAESNIPEEITRGIRFQYARMGIYTRSPTGLGESGPIVFDEPVLMFSMPNDIHVWGNSSEGRWIGEFYPKTGKYEIKIPVGGVPHTMSGQYDQFLMMVDGIPVDDKLMIRPLKPGEEPSDY